MNFNTKPNCKCLPISVEDNFKSSKAVFSGKIINIDTVRYTIGEMEKGHFYENQLISVLKKDIFKGNISTDTIMVMTGIGGGDCGYYFKLNSNYLIYADEQEYNLIDSTRTNGDFLIKKIKYLRTSTCDRTTDSLDIERSRIKSFLKQVSKHGA